MLDRIQHEIIFIKILRDIYQDNNLQAKIAFKGGTCLYMFHKLDRFSTDLDFNIIGDDFNPEEVTKILKTYLIIEEYNKRYTYFWLGSYEKGKQKIKVEMSKRDYPDTYVNVDFYGLTIPTLSKSCMFAHKLCAITDRKKVVNRDLYDAYFMFKDNFEINEKIIEVRTKKTAKEYIKSLIPFIRENVNPHDILQGLGELVDDKICKEKVKEFLNRKILNIDTSQESVMTNTLYGFD